MGNAFPGAKSNLPVADLELPNGGDPLGTSVAQMPMAYDPPEGSDLQFPEPVHHVATSNLLIRAAICRLLNATLGLDLTAFGDFLAEGGQTTEGTEAHGFDGARRHDNH